MRLTGTLIIAAVIVLASGCVKRPGQGVTPSFAEQWNCNYEYVMSQAEQHREGLGSRQVWVPRVGWTACELMARRGKPDDVRQQESRGRRSANWWYGSGTNLTLVSLDLEGSTWRVRYVGRE